MKAYFTLRDIVLFIICAVFSGGLHAQPTVALSAVISTGLSAPMQFVNAGDGSKRVFIVQKAGTILAYDSTFSLLGTFLTVTGISTTGEQGLLSMAFHPDHENNGLFYVYYTTSAGDLELARYAVSTTDSNVADVASKVIVRSIPHPGETNHNGGALHFGQDGMLYLSTGDGGGGGDPNGNAQETDTLLGKILRFDVNTSATAPYYSIPAGNPYGNEVYALGLRNPYRWSFDRLTGDMWIGDVGQGAWEEINYRAAAATLNGNYGWRCYEGNAPYNTAGCSPQSSYISPVLVYPNTSPSSVTGGVVYRGAEYTTLQGCYFAADFYSGNLYKIVPDGIGGWDTASQAIGTTGIVNFGETESGEVYVVSNTGNTVYRLIPGTPTPLGIIKFEASKIPAGVRLQWTTAYESGKDNFYIEHSKDGRVFEDLITIPSKDELSGAGYTYDHNIHFVGDLFFRIRTLKADGSFDYTPIEKVSAMDRQVLIYPTVVQSGNLNVRLTADKYRDLQIFDLAGREVLYKNISGLSGEIQVSVDAAMAQGSYFVVLTGRSGKYTQRIVNP